jgi:hypothetical protein
MAHTPDDRMLVLCIPLAEAQILMEQPLEAAVGFGDAFVLCGCDHCAERLTVDLGAVGDPLHPYRITGQRQQ